MRISLLGLLLCPGLCLAQPPTGHMGTVGVNKVEVTSGSEVSSEHLQAIAREIESDANPPNQPEEIVERARYTLQREGYFEADVSLADVRSVSSLERTVVVTLAIHEGQQYRLKKITFTGNKEIRRSQLRQQFEMADGDIFDVEKTRQGLEQLRKLYASRGYINFAPVPNTQPEEDTPTIVLHIDCDAGKQFHFGKLAIYGRELHPGDAEKMIAAWGPYEGRVYDGGELEAFWNEMAPFLPPEWHIEQHLEIRQDAKTAAYSYRKQPTSETPPEAQLGRSSVQIPTNRDRVPSARC